MNALVTILVAILGCGGWISTLVIALLNRKWKKDDEKKIDPDMFNSMCDDVKSLKKSVNDVKESQKAREELVNALCEASKVTLVKDIKYMGTCLIAAQEVSTDDKQTIDDMYAAYKKLPGANGHCSAIMGAVGHLHEVNEYTRKTTA